MKVSAISCFRQPSNLPHQNSELWECVVLCGVEVTCERHFAMSAPNRASGIDDIKRTFDDIKRTFESIKTKKVVLVSVSLCDIYRQKDLATRFMVFSLTIVLHLIQKDPSPSIEGLASK